MRRSREAKTRRRQSLNWSTVGTQSMSCFPIKAITTGPDFHWFGYYDKLQFDPSGQYALGMRVGFDKRSPTADDVVEIGMVDLHHQNRWIAVGESRAWCWQQGCMLQWCPGSQNEVLWNDRVGSEFICRVADIHTGKTRELPLPVYAVSPDGRTAITTDFRRLNDMRPGYGYVGLPDPHSECLAPETSGIWSIDIMSGDFSLIVSIQEVANIAYPHGDLGKAKHYFNHLLFNPDGTRFVFLHRWRFGNSRFKTRMLTANADGSDVRVLDDSGNTSHLVWRDQSHLFAFTDRPPGGAGFYLFDDKTGEVQHVLSRSADGHCIFLPGGQWVLLDTYPQGPKRLQHLELYDCSSSSRVYLGSFSTPLEYQGEWRCDLHSRVTSDGCAIVFDSTHEGYGRQMYLLDINDFY